MPCSALITSSIKTANECISASAIPQFDSINFVWNEIDFSASSENFGTDGGIIKVSAVLGRLYYTIENENLRKESVAQIQQFNRSSDASCKLESDGTVTYHSLTTSGKKVRGQDFIQTLTMILLDFSPQLRNLKSSLRSV